MTIEEILEEYILFPFKGEWNSNTSYKKLDIVFYRGMFYMAKHGKIARGLPPVTIAVYKSENTLDWFAIGKRRDIQKYIQKTTKHVTA